MSEVVESAPSAEVSSEPSVEAPKASAEPTKATIKVFGKEEEHDLESLKKFAQIGKAGQSKFEEATKLRKEAESLKERLKNDWVGALKELGIDPREATEKFLSERLREEMLSPEEKAQQAKDKEHMTLKEKLAALEAEKEQAKYDQERQQYEAQLEKEIPQALEKVGLPRSPASLRRIANQLMIAMEGGYEMSVEEAAELAKSEIQGELSQLLSMGGRYEDLIPASVAEKLMEAHLGKVKSAPQYKSNAPTASQPSATPKKYMTESEWKKMFE